jgi:hypothetical protein
MGKGEKSRAEAQAQNFSTGQKKNRGGCEGTVGEVQSGEENFLGSDSGPAFN